MDTTASAGSLQLAREWLDRHPDVAFVIVAAHDLNGVLRGKRIPRTAIDQAIAGHLKMPLALIGVDIWGRDVVGSGQVFETGDTDGYCIPTGRGLVALDARAQSDALLLVSLHSATGSPYSADPRNALAAIVARYRMKGLTPVCATELEFYLYDLNRSDGPLRVAPGAGGPGRTSAIYAVSELDAFRPFIDDVYEACNRAEIPVDSAIAESGFGQFEINLRHGPDALRAADDALYFKHLVKRVARSHQLGATFMAKPFGEDSGSGLHIHFSLIDSNGANLFDSGEPTGSQMLRFAVAGLLRFMPDTTLFFAPHYNSFRRLRRETHAPVNIAWGYDNRTTAIRIPDSLNNARRIEHRVAGADANPYLVMAAVLGAALDGLESECEPPGAISGSAYDAGVDRLPTNWLAAIDGLEASSFNQRLFGELLPRMYVACKRQEFESFADIVSPLEHELYLETI